MSFWKFWHVLALIGICSSQLIEIKSCCGQGKYFTNGVCVSSSNHKMDSQIIQNYFTPIMSEEMSIQYSVEEHDFKCPSESEILKGVELQVNEPMSVSIVSPGIIQYNRKYYNPEQICIQSLNSNQSHMGIFICQPNCKEFLCLQKCCNLDHHLYINESSVQCQKKEDNEKWIPNIYGNKRTREIHWIYRPPRYLCSNGIFYVQSTFLHYPKNPFRILENGLIMYRERSRWIPIEDESYCIEGFKSSNPNLPPKDLMFKCIKPSIEDVDDLSRNQSYQIGIIVGCFLSSFFVLLTISIYILLWETQNIHGWTLMASFLSLLSLYVSLGLMNLYHLLWDIAANQRTTMCWTIGVWLHFSYLSFFSWATVVNFDLWYTFRELRSIQVRNVVKLRKFGKYAVFGIGIPLVVISLSLGFDWLYRQDDEAEYLLPDPDYGSDKCFLARNEAPIAYLLGPIGILLIFNVIFIMATLCSVYKAQQVASMAINSSSRRHQQSLKLFGKLLIVMGLFWIFDILSFVLSRDSVPWYFAIFDLLNIAHGLFIFIIFVCKKSTLKALAQKYSTIKRLDEFMKDLSNRRRSSTSFSTKFRGTNSSEVTVNNAGRSGVVLRASQRQSQTTTAL